MSDSSSAGSCAHWDHSTGELDDEDGEAEDGAVGAVAAVLRRLVAVLRARCPVAVFRLAGMTSRQWQERRCHELVTKRSWHGSHEAATAAQTREWERMHCSRL